MNKYSDFFIFTLKRNVILYRYFTPEPAFEQKCQRGAKIYKFCNELFEKALVSSFLFNLSKLGFNQITQVSKKIALCLIQITTLIHSAILSRISKMSLIYCFSLYQHYIQA